MGTFALQLAEFAKRAGGNAEAVIRKTGLDMSRKVILRSPVDKGAFRQNWNPSLESADPSVSEAVDPSGSDALQRCEQTLTGLKLGQSYFLVNNLPYGPRLENGYSNQAPAGFVKITVAEFQQIVDRAAQEVRNE